MLLVFLLTLGVNQDVVDENNDELVEIGFSHPVHKIHEYRRCVRKSERHNQELVVTIASSECCLRDVLLADSQLMIS